MKVKQLKRKMAALLAVAMVMTGQPSGVLAGGMPGDSGEASAEVTETVSTDSDASQNTEPDGSEIPPATNSTADSGTAGGNGGTGTDIPKEEQETFEVTYQVEPEEGAKVTGDRTVKTGETLEFTVRVNEGYELDSVSVSGDVLEPTEEEDNKYSYEAANIMQAPTVEVSLVEAPMLMSLTELDDATPSDAIFVSKDGSDEKGDGSEEHPYASLAEAVDAATKGKEEANIQLLTDVYANRLALVDGVDITIDGNGHTVTRADNFSLANDGRGAYNPAMIEVANGATLILEDITLDDAFKREANLFELHKTGEGNKENETRVQDGIIAAYGDGEGTIILGDGTTLKNFGGLSAVYITGEGGEGATLIMKSGSKICDDGSQKRAGGYAAIFNHGGTVQAEESSSIEDIDGRAIYADNAGVTTFAGSIKNITSSEAVKNPEDAGVVYYGRENTMFTLASGGIIENINSHDGTAADSALHLYGCTFKTERDSEIRDLNVGIADMDGATVDLAGSITNGNAKDVFFRLRGTQGTFTLRETGSITKCDADTALVYLNGGKPTITIAGTIDDINVPVLFISNNGSRKNGEITLTKTGVITNITGYGMILEDPSRVTIEGTITNCSSYAIQYYPKGAQSLLTIKDTATIENNNGGKAQVRAQNTLPATDAQEHIVIASEALKGNKTIDLNAFGVTLDDNVDIKLGNASSEAATAIKGGIEKQHPDWTAVGSSAVWIQPSEENIHFTVPRLDSMKKTALFAALLPLNADGRTPVEGAELILPEVNNADPVDVTFTDLIRGQSYAMMFVNNNEYTLAPDDTTIYIGGGQGDEIYNDGGFPALSIAGSVDKITILEIEEQTITTGDLMTALLDRLEVSYTDKDGNPATSDATPGEYTVTLSWKDNLTNADVRINGNNVAGLDAGTLIVRHIDNIEGATTGKTTYELLTEEPTATESYARALAKNVGTSKAKFYTNDDENREADVAGIQLLDDTLLTDEGDNRQELMENKAAKYLGDPGENMVYRYNFRYLDLVDAFDGNAWVSASYGTTVYLPYPEGVTAETAKGLGVTVLHYKDLHREYGITGPDVEPAIEACELETMTPEFTQAGIKIEVEREGFSPFAVVWKVPAQTYQLTINYLDDETEEKIIDVNPVVKDVVEGTQYDVTAETRGKVIKGYNFVRTDPEAVTGTVKGNIIINAYYSKKPTYTVTINYLDEETKEAIKGIPAITKNYVEGDAYDVTADANKTIEGYTFKRIEGEVTGTITGNVTINVYYTRKSTGGGPSGSGSSGGSGVAYTVGLNGNWVHMDPNDINTPISQVVPDGATPVSNPEWHQWKFILTDGSALTNRWAFIRNPYAVEGQPSEGWFSFDENGIMNYGWYLDQSTGKWYFLHRQSDGMLGTMMEGWHHDEQDGRWYYLQPGSGEMLLGWQEIGGRWYYFNPNAPQVTWNYNEATGGWTYNGSQSRPYGSMYQNEVTPDGYQVDGSGAWVQ